MKPITLADLKRVNQASIRRAGPRYAPAIDANAPNLEIQPLVNAIEALAHSAVYKKQLDDLEEELRSAWQNAPTELLSLFDGKTAASVLCATFVKQLRQEKPGSSVETLRRIRGTLKTVLARIQPYEQDLYSQRVESGKTTEIRNDVTSRLYALQKFQRPIEKLRNFTDATGFALIQNNRLFLKGGWGAGKTHLLCDIAKARTSRSLPTLLLLAQTFSRGIDPLAAACQVSGLARTPHELLSALDHLGKKTNSRTLLIIDGINEGDRTAWHRHMNSIVNRLQRFRNVALILSCRTPFDNQVLTGRVRSAFVQAIHTGFEDIEFDAQREFFRYYKIPAPHIPLLAPEFSRPLFLKILCETVTSLSRDAKHKRINDFAAGHKGMTKLLEDFVVQVGRKIETDFRLPDKSCWRLLKGQGDGAAAVGISVQMAERGRDYVPRTECLEIIAQITGLGAADDAEAFLARLVTDGLLSEDGIFEDGVLKDVVRLPYQRFSDHLISRHLLSRYLKTQSETAIHRSFYVNRPLGRIFKPDRWGRNYEMPSLASAVMLEFPERVKRALPDDKRELVFYLPQRSRAGGLTEVFVEGLLWRSTDSFCAQTDRVVSHLLESGDRDIQEKILEALVCLASRTGHHYSAERLYRYLSRKSLVDRDIFWSEFLRSRTAPSAVYRVLDWILSDRKEAIGEATTGNLIQLCALLLTTAVRTLRDRATKCLVLLGEKHPQLLLEATAASFAFNDPYIPERMLAASYGVLMRKWAFPTPGLKDSAVTLAIELRHRLAGSRTVAPIEHILMRDYAEGIIALAAKISANARPRLSLDGLRISKKSVIPSGYRIAEGAVKAASDAIRMDFDNYTTGRLVENRANYDDSHKDYRRVRRQIRWRILNLGYDSEKFKYIDRDIASSNFHMGRSDGGKKIDRYGKKYSWIAFFEVAGRRRLAGTLPDRHDIRISDTDIDPSFSEHALEWRPPMRPLFDAPYRSASGWMGRGPNPDYRPLLTRKEVDGVLGPWVLLQGYINERGPRDSREAFTFLRGLMIAPEDVSRLKAILRPAEYPGNHAVPEPGEDHYLFAGEIGWSRKYGSRLRRKNGRAKPQLEEAFGRTEHRVIEKPYGELTRTERAAFTAPSLEAFLAGEDRSVPRGKKIPVSHIVKLQGWVRIPGVAVELPSWRFGWESYHSEENEGGNPDYPAPALVDYLGLRKIGASVDLVEASGRLAMIYRKFGNADGLRSDLLYLRADLLKKYLARTGRCLAWINWGERSLHYSALEKLRENPAMRAVWDSHAHIHKQFVVYQEVNITTDARSGSV
jgi:DNA replication protein DnaC